MNIFAKRFCLRNGALLLALCAFSLLFSCQKEKNFSGEDEEMSPRERKIANLLRSAGVLENHPDRELIPVNVGSPDTVLVQNHTSKLAEDAPHYRVTQRQKVDFFSSESQFTLLNPWPSVAWPGCLIQGKSLRGNAVPTSIPIYKQRKPGRILFNVVSGKAEGGEEQNWYVECEQMRQSEVLNAQNHLLSSFLKTGTPAKLSYKIDVVRNAEEMLAHSSINVKAFGGELRAQFDGLWNTSKSHVLVVLKQEYFTMSYEDPDKGFRGVFTNDISSEDLEPYTGNGNPICYVSSVTYGRVYYLLYTADCEEELLKASLAAKYKSASVEGEGEVDFKYQKVLSTASVSLLLYGGNAEEGLETVTLTDINQITEILKEGAHFDENHVGAPISFTVKQLYTGELVHMENTLNYEYDNVRFIPKNQTGSDVLEIEIQKFVAEGFGRDGYKTSNSSYFKINSIDILYRNKEGKELKSVKVPHSTGHTCIVQENWLNIYYSDFMKIDDNFSKAEIFLNAAIQHVTYKNGTQTSDRDLVIKLTILKQKDGFVFLDEGDEKMRSNRVARDISCNYGTVSTSFYVNAYLNNMPLIGGF